MAATRQGKPDLHVRLPSKAAAPAVPLPDLPPISALFLIDFDVKAGYTISWKAAKADIELDDVVEYKSLPSGLHTVHQDLIYFVHDDHAGLSAFVNAPCEDSDARNARMLAVGVLVPLSFGRLGRAWRHAEGLKSIADKLASTSSKDTVLLEQYWENNQARDDVLGKQALAPKESLDSPAVTFHEQVKLAKQRNPLGSLTRARSASDGTGLLPPGYKLSAFHPAWSLSALVDTFGPLIFPIHRAALLRKRILITCHAPVQEACNFVYDISILSNIPLSTLELLPPGSPPHRLRPLFTIGVHDIPYLVEDAKASHEQSKDKPSEAGTGWVACTTDSILAMKDTLWDVLITMPPPHAAAAKAHVWPRIEAPGGHIIKATQRDLRRFRALRTGLKRYSDVDSESSNESAVTPRRTSPSPVRRKNDLLLDDAAENVVEPLSWAALAYNGFLWWASAGDISRSTESEESGHDASLLADVAAPWMGPPRSAASQDLPQTPTAMSDDEARAELTVIAYFHRLTTQMLGTLADAVQRHAGGDADVESDVDDDDSTRDAGDDDPEVGIDSDTLRGMGLDVWSKADAAFAKELALAYFGRQGHIEGKGVEICGVRIC